MFSPTWRPLRTASPVLLLAALVPGLLVVLAMLEPAVAHAALAKAAPGADGSKGFAELHQFFTNIGGYLRGLGIPLGVLALIGAGISTLTGNPAAAGLLGKAALGIGVILLAQPIAA